MSFYIFPIKTLFCVGCTAILSLWVMKKLIGAKSTLDLLCVKVGVPYTDFKYYINQYVLYIWQEDWNGVVVNKLPSVKPVLGDWQSSYRRCSKDEVVLYCSCIRHTHLTHSYILRKDPPPRSSVSVF